MKKSLLVVALSAFGMAGFAQTFVSTSPENRNVVLEEFTGIYCTFCPDGHLRAQQLKDANPGDVVLVNSHSGGYAEPSGSDPDFRTSFGSALANQSGLCGYPAGTVNREYFAGFSQTDNSGNPCGVNAIAQGRGTWQTTGTQVLAESSPVNVAGQATLDLSTRKLTVVVEAYYTGNAVNPTNKVTVAVLQNGVVGPQTGSSANPSQVNPDGSYNHNHMLRHFMTGQWGASVTPTTTGSFFTDTYVWDVPTDINGVPLELNNLEVVVYIAEGNKDIITGSDVELSVISPNAYDAVAAGVDVPDFVCESEVAPVVTIQNMGNETITSCIINYSINGVNAPAYQWTGSLATAQATEVTLPMTSFTHLSTNTLWVAVNSPNGQTDAVASNNVTTKEFQPSKNSGTTIDLTIVTDQYGYETYWEIQDPFGSVVASGGNTSVGINGGGGQSAAAGDPGAYGANATVNETVTLASTGCHKFVVVDDWGDGMCCAYGNGSYTVASNGTNLYVNGQFGGSEERTFNVGGTNGINDLELVNNVSVFPNPFNDIANVNYSLVENGVVTVEVFNTLGAKVISENLGEKTAGAHSTAISADGLDAGVYMVNLSVNGSIFSTRVSIAK